MDTARRLFARLLSSVVLPTSIIVVSLYIFHTLGEVHYLVASLMAFSVGCFSIYLVFKYWINTDIKNETPEQQMTRFMVVFTINVAINAEIVYLLVTHVGVPLLTAQAVAAVIVAYESYYAYRSLVFRNTPKKTVGEILAEQVAAQTISRDKA